MSFELMNQLTREDAEARADMFMSTLLEEIANDEEPYQKKCRQLARALLEKDAEGVIIALCGWSTRSIAMKSLLIRDTAQEFHDDDFVNSTLIVKYVNGDTAEGECAVNPATHEVKDFNPELFDNKYSAVDSVSVELGNDGECLLCYPEDEVVFDEDAFWYAALSVVAPDNTEVKKEGDEKWVAKHISEIQNGDIVRYGEELYLATSDAYLTDTLIGKEWNFSVVGGMEEYLYATNFEGAMVDVLLPGKIEYLFTANANWTPIQNSKFAPSANDFASMVYTANGNYVELDIVDYCGRLTFYCEHSAVNEEYADEMVTCKFSLSQMTPETLREKMVAICQQLCEGKTLSNCIA